MLEHREELGLQLQREIADLVEEDRAPVGHLEEPLAGLLGVGEGALLVAEQLALDQRARQGRAVHVHERPVGLA